MTAVPADAPAADLVWVPGGAFAMGSDRHYPEEAPVRRVAVDGFWIDRAPVTNDAFRRFVRETGYVTVAERAPDPAAYPGADPAGLVPGSTVFVPPSAPVDLSDHHAWWRYVPGADWRRPRGPGSDIRGRARHPVVHVAWADAVAYAGWAGKALPTEVEWEFAARGGLEAAEYAWGDELTPGGRRMANTWRGVFPTVDAKRPDARWTSRVGVFPANGYGVHDMIGNVWEWTRDWYADPGEAGCCGGARERSVDPSERAAGIPRKVLKGGSHLCAPNYCRRYRPAARMPHPVDTGTSHVGFRCVVRP